MKPLSSMLFGRSGDTGTERGVARTSGGVQVRVSGFIRDEGFTSRALTSEGSVVGARQAERLRRAHCHDGMSSLARASSQLPTAMRGSRTRPAPPSTEELCLFQNCIEARRLSSSLFPFFRVSNVQARREKKGDEIPSRPARNGSLLAGGDARGRMIHAGFGN